MSVESLLSTTEQACVDGCAELAVLTADSAYPGAAHTADPALTLLRVSNRHAGGTLALQGAQVLSFIPQGHPDLLWLSPNAQLQTGATIRGGIPVCMPWFGIHQGDPDKPRHGFVRTLRWQLEQAATDDAGHTRLLLALRQFADQAHPLFPWRFSVELQLTFGPTLVLQPSVTNCADSPMPLSWALHSYHPVSELETTTVSGLRQTNYLDNTRGLARTTQQGDPRFDGEFDRVYLNVGAQQTIVTANPIRISADHAPSAIVWNPGAELTTTMAGLGSDLHRQFICLERGAAFDDQQSLAPGQTLRARVEIAPARAATEQG